MKLIFATDAIFHPLTGIGRYALELALRLPQVPGVESVKYFNLVRWVGRPQAQMEQGVVYLPMLRRAVLANPLLVRMYRWAVPKVQARVLKGCSDHLYHSPNYFLPPFSGACVSTFHDLSHVRWPQCHPAGRVRFMDREIPVALARAGLVIAVSHFTRQEILAFYGMNPSRVVAIPLAARPEFHPRTAAQTQALLNNMGLGYSGYVLYVGTLEPRKNVAALLTAYERLPRALRGRYPLVLAGDKGWGSGNLLHRIERGQRQGWLCYLGFVTESALPALYAGARAFAYPSLYEGFGLPVLEALVSGVPVVCSNAASLPEVAGDAALLHDPEDSDGLAQGLQRALEDEPWRAQAIERGLQRAEEFSWDRTAAETVAAYQRLLGWDLSR